MAERSFVDRLCGFCEVHRRDRVVVHLALWSGLLMIVGLLLVAVWGFSDGNTASATFGVGIAVWASGVLARAIQTNRIIKGHGLRYTPQQDLSLRCPVCRKRR